MDDPGYGICWRCGAPTDTDWPFSECFKCLTDLSTWDQTPAETRTLSEDAEDTTGKPVLPS